MTTQYIIKNSQLENFDIDLNPEQNYLYFRFKSNIDNDFNTYELISKKKFESLKKKSILKSSRANSFFKIFDKADLAKSPKNYLDNIKSLKISQLVDIKETNIKQFINFIATLYSQYVRFETVSYASIAPPRPKTKYELDKLEFDSEIFNYLSNYFYSNGSQINIIPFHYNEDYKDKDMHGEPKPELLWWWINKIVSNEFTFNKENENKDKLINFFIWLIYNLYKLIYDRYNSKEKCFAKTLYRVEDKDYLNLIELEENRRQQNSFKDLYKKGNNKIYYRNNRFLSTQSYGASIKDKNIFIEDHHMGFLQNLENLFDDSKKRTIGDILTLNNAILPGLSDNDLNHILWIYHNHNGYSSYLPIGFNYLLFNPEGTTNIIDAKNELRDMIKILTLKKIFNDSDLFYHFKMIQYYDLLKRKGYNEEEIVKMEGEVFKKVFLKEYNMNEDEFIEIFKQGLLDTFEKIDRKKYLGFDEQESLVAPCSLIEIKRIYLYSEDFEAQIELDKEQTVEYHKSNPFIYDKDKYCDNYYKNDYTVSVGYLYYLKQFLKKNKDDTKVPRYRAIIECDILTEPNLEKFKDYLNSLNFD